MRTLCALITLLASGCAFAPPPVPVSGSAAALAELEGEWVGEYWSDDAPGRHGVIYFRLSAAHDSAFGDVIMLLEPGPAGVQSPERRESWAQLATRHQVLAIRFVRVEAGAVMGRLDAYQDPVCGCTLDTSFVGTIRDGVIEGTYTSRHVQGGSVTSGHWKAVRRQS